MTIIAGGVCFLAGLMWGYLLRVFFESELGLRAFKDSAKRIVDATGKIPERALRRLVEKTRR